MKGPQLTDREYLNDTNTASVKNPGLQNNPISLGRFGQIEVNPYSFCIMFLKNYNAYILRNLFQVHLFTGV